MSVSLSGTLKNAVSISHPSASHMLENNLRQDSQGVGVTQTALPALNGDNGLVGPDDTHVQGVLQSIPDSVVDVDLPLGGRDSSRFGVVNGGRHLGSSGTVER